MALITDIADAVVTALNAGTFALEFTAVRTLVPQVKLEDMSTLHVKVVPTTTRSRLVTRTATEREFIIDVGVQQKCDVDDDDVTDPLVTLCEAIEALLFGKVLTAGSKKAICIAVNDPAGRDAADYSHASTLRQFTSVSHFTYKVVS